MDGTGDPDKPKGLTHAQSERLWGWVDRWYGDFDPRDGEQVQRIVEWIDGKQQPATAGGKTEAA